MNGPFISVVIPVWRDVESAVEAAASAGEGVEIVAVAAWEDADAVAALRPSHPHVRWIFARRGRGNQMNAGAAAAAGEWLIFLHADSRLPNGWVEAIRAASARGCDAGCYRLGIAAGGWRPRVWEWLVRLRVALLTLPYGDQGLFVRRTLFQALGGYRDIPLMEDVDFVSGVRRCATFWKATQVVLTSARRWERDGWVRRSAANLTLVSRYRLGVDVRRLARAYLGQAETVVAVLARTPSAEGKRRLGTSTPELRCALLLDTWDAVLDGAWDAALVFTPAESAAECASLVRGSPRAPLLVPQGSGDLGARMSAAFRELFAAGYLRVILIGSDLPTLPAENLRAAELALRGSSDVVIGPADDGGYYLIGLTQSRDAIFAGIRWGGGDVLAETKATAERAGLRLTTIAPWYDVDSPEDLRRVSAGSDARAVRTRRLIGR